MGGLRTATHSCDGTAEGSLDGLSGQVDEQRAIQNVTIDKEG